MILPMALSLARRRQARSLAEKVARNIIRRLRPGRGVAGRARDRRSDRGAL